MRTSRSQATRASSPYEVRDRSNSAPSSAIPAAGAAALPGLARAPAPAAAFPPVAGSPPPFIASIVLLRPLSAADPKGAGGAAPARRERLRRQRRYRQDYQAGRGDGQ